MAVNIVTQAMAEAVLASVPHDDRTTGGLFLPHFDNSGRLDIARLRASLILIDALLSGSISAAEVQAIIAAAFAEFVGSAPAALDTVYELAAAFGNNPDVIDQLLAQIATKATTIALADEMAARVAVADTLALLTTRVGDTETGKASLAGATFIGRVNLEFATLAAGNGAVNFATRNGYNTSQVGAMTLTVSGLANGQDGQVNHSYASGALSFAGVDRWVIGSAEVSTLFSATEVGGVGLVTSGVYQFVFSKAADIVVGRAARVK